MAAGVGGSPLFGHIIFNDRAQASPFTALAFSDSIQVLMYSWINRNVGLLEITTLCKCRAFDLTAELALK